MRPHPGRLVSEPPNRELETRIMPPELQSLVRHLLTALGAILVSSGKLTQGDAEGVTGALILLVSFGWSQWDKRSIRVQANADVKPPGSPPPTLALLMTIGFSSALAMALVLPMTGCATASGKPVDLAPLVRSATYTGASVYLLSKPQERPAFELAATALGNLSRQPTVGLEDLKLAFGPLLDRDIRELRDARTRIVVDGAVLLVDSELGQVDLGGTDRGKQIRDIAEAAATGLKLALGATQSP